MPFDPPETFNIADHFLADRLREGRGGRVAIRTADGQLTYTEVERLAARFGHALRELGVRQEERVVIALPDGPDYVGALFGTLKLGAVVVMVNPSQPAEQLAAILGYARARVAVVDGPAVPALEDAIRTAGTGPRLLVVDGDASGHPAFASMDVPDQLDAVPTHRDDPAIWLFSGGTTGRPKAVVQPHRSYAYTTACYAVDALGYREDDVTLSVPKLYFGYATGCNLLFPFAVGASTVLFPEHPTADVLFERIATHRPTILVNVPSMISQLLDHPAAGDQDLSSLRFSTSAGEALPAALYERWVAAFGVELLDGLGTAEQWHIFVSNLPGQVRPGTLGKVVPGFDLAVRDDEGHDVPDGEVGALWVRGGARAIAYWQNLERTQEVFRGEWVVTGDLVQRDADGWVTYVGRGDDAIKVKGKWLIPAEVEGVLLEHDAVAECAVVAIEDDDGLLKPIAFVVPAVDVPEDLDAVLRDHVLDRLDAYKHPRRVVIVDDLPRTHLGKVDRRGLQALVG